MSQQTNTTKTKKTGSAGSSKTASTATKSTSQTKSAKSASSPKAGSTSSKPKSNRLTAEKIKSKLLSKQGAVAAGVAAAAAASVAAVTVARRRSQSREVFHLVPDGEGWQIEAEGSSNGSAKTFETKREALDTAREQARKAAPSQLVIHRSDGTIQSSHTYD